MRPLDGALNTTGSTPRRVLHFGLAWFTLWAAFWTIVVATIAILHPNSLDPREGPLAMAFTLGPMGLLSGMAFGILRTIWPRGAQGRPLIHLAASGILATAVVQVPSLGHGNVAPTVNANVALICAAGGVLTMVWLAVTRRGAHRRSSLS